MTILCAHFVHSKEIFFSMGFRLTTQEDGAELLEPPVVEANLPDRAKLLRAWVELSAWLFEFKRKHSSSLCCMSWRRLMMQ